MVEEPAPPWLKSYPICTPAHLGYPNEPVWWLLEHAAQSAGLNLRHGGPDVERRLVEPGKIVAGEGNPMEVSFVTESAPEQTEQIQEQSKPEQPQPVVPDTPQLESMVQPPEPDLPPPVFPVPPPPPRAAARRCRCRSRS